MNDKVFVLFTHDQYEGDFYRGTFKTIEGAKRAAPCDDENYETRWSQHADGEWWMQVRYRNMTTAEWSEWTDDHFISEEEVGA